MKIHVFYGAQYLANETKLDDIKTVPDGAYIKMGTNWYIMMNRSLVPMNKGDVPANVKAMLTLLGETK